METPINQKVTGVSRSGRVRKKSSKLLDFRSPDDIETKSKKGQKVPRHNPKMLFGQFKEQQNFDDVDLEINMDLKVDADDDYLIGQDSDENLDLEYVSGELINDDDDEEDDNNVDPTVRQSLYMMEKSNKKKIYKDGKIVYGKAQRKDKGKTRFTAYMLWARDARTQFSKKQSDMDFATASRRLGEMWANVPAAEKVIWRRKAKRLVTKIRKSESKQSAIKESSSKVTSSTFINRATTSRTKKIAQQCDTVANANNNTKIVVNTKVAVNSKVALTKKTNKINSTPTAHVSLATIPKSNTTNIIQPGVYKVTGLDPIDVAAHLRLLGESLTIIGERLKEHEGQITVSGSLSVLLDSLLCSLGPLMCLTMQVPGCKQDNNLKDLLHKTLDNIAYVMPGL